MMKILKLLLLIILMCTTCSCTKEKTEPVVHDVVEESKQEENKNNQVKQDAFDEFSVLITAKAINIRSNPDVTNKENIIGQVYMGETYTVFEESKTKDYTWYRIGKDKWIANDGSWCVEYDKDKEKRYPYVIDEEEVKELLSIVGAGSSCYTSSDAEVYYYLNIYGDSDDKQYPLQRKIYVGTNGSGFFKYDIGKIVKISDTTYDVYVIPELEYNRQDNPIGCIRMSNIGIYFSDFGNVTHPYCDVTFIQNNNDVTIENLWILFGIEIHFSCSHQVHI